MSVHIPYTTQRRISTCAPQLRATNGFCRVTKYRRCRVCGKPDWCGFTADEQISICMRMSNGCKGTSRNGGYIFHHNRLLLAITSPGIARKQAPPAIEIAPIEVRTAVYQELIRRSPAVKYYSQLIDGPNGLLSRGLRESDAQNYGALPRTHKERAGLAHTLNKFLKVRFPEKVGRRTHAAILSVPGFCEDERGNLQLWSRDYNMPLLVVPYRDFQGRIQACQLRLHRNDFRPGEKKYRWLACPFPFRGASSGTPIHFTFRPTDLPPVKTVIITEGALKAEVLVSLRPKARVIATSGVSSSHAEVIDAARPYNALIAFDADYKTNPVVARQLARLIAARERDIVIHQLSTSTKIVCWRTYKGIDDAVLANSPFETMTILEWFATLEGKILAEVKRAWNVANYHPWISLG